MAEAMELKDSLISWSYNKDQSVTEYVEKKICKLNWLLQLATSEKTLKQVLSIRNS